jgi:hypothetical protein
MEELRANSDLTHLVGSEARLWHYTASHDQLTIEVSLSLTKRLYLVCVSCAKISVPRFWSLEKPEIVNAGERWLIFRDKEVEVKCEHLVIQEASEVGSLA